MATKSPNGQAVEDKLQALGAAPAPKVDPLEGAKKAFEQALEKTKAQADGEGEEVVVIEEPKKKAPKAKAAPAPAVEQPKHDELAAIKAELAEMKRERAERAQPKPEPEVDPYEVVKAQLAEQFGEDEGDILAKALKAINEPSQRRIAQLEEFIQKASEKSRNFTAKNNRTRLKENYPQLANEEAWEVVKERAQSVMSKYDSLDDAYDATARALYGDSSKAAASREDDEAEEEASRIAASLPTAPSGKTRERKLSGDEKARAIFNHLLENPEDATGAKKLARQLKAY